MRHTANEIRRIKRGEIRHANHVARIDLHSHNSASRTCAATYNAIGSDKLFKLLLGNRLHTRRNREIHVVALTGRRFAFHLMHHAIGIRHDHAFTVRTGKVAVVYRLNARLADLVTAFIIHSRRRIFQNAVGNRADIAKHLAREGFIRIYAMRALLHIDARKRIGVLGNKSNIAASRGRRHLALGLRATRRVFDALAHNGIRQTEQS